MRIVDLIYYGRAARWYEYEPRGEERDSRESVLVVVELHGKYSEVQARALAADAVRQSRATWIEASPSEWRLDLERMHQVLPQCKDLEWMRGGSLTAVPEYDHVESTRGGLRGRRPRTECEARLAVTITEESLRAPLTFPLGPENVPADLVEPLNLFRQDNPADQACGFIMMRFADTPLHNGIQEAIRATLTKLGFRGLRSDDKEYADDVLGNVRTYMHGCDFGIAILERLTEEEFNPNISLEIGYMMAMGKPVLLLKDQTLKQLHSDIVGRLYRPFDSQTPEKGIPPAIETWLIDKGFLRR